MSNTPIDFANVLCDPNTKEEQDLHDLLKAFIITVAAEIYDVRKQQERERVGEQDA